MCSSINKFNPYNVQKRYAPGTGIFSLSNFEAYDQDITMKRRSQYGKELKHVDTESTLTKDQLYDLNNMTHFGLTHVQTPLLESMELNTNSDNIKPVYPRAAPDSRAPTEYKEKSSIGCSANAPTSASNSKSGGKETTPSPADPSPTVEERLPLNIYQSNSRAKDRRPRNPLDVDFFPSW